MLAEWVATLALALNDLILVAKGFEDAETPYERMYYGRLLISHFHEASLYLAETKDISEVEAFVASLREEAQQDYANALAGFEARRSELHRIRSHVFHYPALKSQRGQKMSSASSYFARET